MVISLLYVHGWNPLGVEEEIGKNDRNDQESPKRYAGIFYYSSKEIRRLRTLANLWFVGVSSFAFRRIRE